MEPDTADVIPLPSTPDAVELRHLRAFVAVADDLNFTRAANRLFLSPPALSRQIRTLERLVGCELLRRSTRSVELTLAGEALLERARRVLTDVDAAVTATRSVGDELAARVTRLWQHYEAPGGLDVDLQQLRDTSEAFLQEFETPDDVVVRSVNAGGVPALTLSQTAGRTPELLYLHGGGYVSGSAFAYRPLAGAIASATGTCVLVPDYRLAPEHPFPAAVEDAVAAYRWLLRNTDPARVVVAGDSSGAGLVLSLLLSAEAEGLPMPAGAVLMCPTSDPTGGGMPDDDDAPHEDRAPHLPPDQVRRIFAHYLSGHPVDDPLVAPLLADLTGLPPLLIQAGSGDPAVTDARRLADHARTHDVDTRLRLYPVNTHNFPLFWSFLPEAGDALRAIDEFVRDVLRAPHMPFTGPSTPV